MNLFSSSRRFTFFLLQSRPDSRVINLLVGGITINDRLLDDRQAAEVQVELQFQVKTLLYDVVSIFIVAEYIRLCACARFLDNLTSDEMCHLFLKIRQIITRSCRLITQLSQDSLISRTPVHSNAGVAGFTNPLAGTFL